MKIKIAFIGAGIATSYTLIPFLDQLNLKKGNKKIQLFIIDKSEDFFKGMPYGNRSGKSVLLIQDLKNFITDPHRTRFKDWLNKNINDLVLDFLKHGGDYAAKWVNKNKSMYEAGMWDDLYIPRFFFGKYIHLEVNQRIEKLVKKQEIEVLFIKKEVINVTKKDEIFHIT